MQFATGSSHFVLSSLPLNHPSISHPSMYASNAVHNVYRKQRTWPRDRVEIAESWKVSAQNKTNVWRFRAVEKFNARAQVVFCAIASVAERQPFPKECYTWLCWSEHNCTFLYLQQHLHPHTMQKLDLSCFVSRLPSAILQFLHCRRRHRRIPAWYCRVHPLSALANT